MVFAEEGVPNAAVDILEQARTVAPSSLAYWARLKQLQPEDADVLHGFDRVSLKLKQLQEK